MEQYKVLILHRSVNSGRHTAAVILLASILLTLGVGTATARTYRWVDETGTTVYSQVPPPPGTETSRIAPPPPPAESPDEVQQRLNKRLQRFEDNREDRELARENAAKDATAQAERDRLCEAARANLLALEQSRGNTRYVTDSGEYKRLTDEDLKAKMDEAREAIASNCSDE